MRRAGDGGPLARPRKKTRPAGAEGDPLWYKDAIIYEARVRSFYDCDGDGIGDFRGFSEKLDYLQDLGVTAIWLLPFYPSPLRDDGYDISDYTNVHPECGTLHDFKNFLREAHRRDLRVIIELVINHTSDQHPWFQRARRAPSGSPWRDFYVWSDTPQKYAGTRIIFSDFEPSNWTWDPVAGAYFWHRFYSNQPDLNYDNPEVHEAVFRVLDFWLDLGVDGLRLDAVPYLYEREGTSCENLPETHAFLRKLRAHVDARFENRMLLAEANQWPEDAVPYFGEGDECHMSFHFPIMPRLFMALHMEDRFPIIDILDQTPAIPETAQWALFLRNHDELTLEMVTDEERDYMYRVYAHDQKARINLGIRRRLAPLLGNDRRRIELMNALLFSLPGTPILYYGDEIGMGDNFYLGDRDGVRTPMQWSPDRNAGFSRANPQRLYLPVIIDPEYNYETVNVEAQHNNPHSLLWWMKRLITLRKGYKAFGRGGIEFLSPSNRKVLAFVRHHERETLLIVCNLSRFVQYVELDLSGYQGMSPIELFGRTAFPPIGELPYLLTLGPHAFYWFSLETGAERQAAILEEEAPLPSITLKGSWESILRSDGRQALEKVLPDHVRRRRWFGGKAFRFKSLRVIDQVPVDGTPLPAFFAFVQIEYADAAAEIYVLPLTFVVEPQRIRYMRDTLPHAAVAEVHVRTKDGQADGLLIDALEEAAFDSLLLDAIGRRRTLAGPSGQIAGLPARAFRDLRAPQDLPLPATTLKVEQSNSSVLFGQRLLLKLYRRLHPGINPDLEVGRFLAEETDFTRVAPLAGSLEYRPARGEAATLATLQGYVANEGDAWAYTLDEVARYLDHALARPIEDVVLPEASVLQLSRSEPPELALELLGAQLESARLLGRRTAELHLALASSDEDPAFAPEWFTPLSQRALYQSMRNLHGAVFRMARDRLGSLSEEQAEQVRRAISREGQILKTFQAIRDRKISATRIRCHGDYHLGQVLYTGKDFVIIDFEGEPARPLSERRRKRSPLQDLAGMLRSFRYAAHTVLRQQARGVGALHDVVRISRWTRFWCAWASSNFLKSYLHVAGHASFVPQSIDEIEVLLSMFCLEKAVYELGYELRHRPDWVEIPVEGIIDLLEARH
jgi:maltose alpha-D-glucosyltransferase/alpha-amylase